jgi:DNA-binding response OmpR family regulator
MSESSTLEAVRIPTVYFIDDSATMREVIKIAFRRENIHVITCADASTALAQFDQAAPDVVITDVIMPDKDGYEVCDFIKNHENFGKTPVLLMSGVVNRAVAEKAMAVKADELIRKPFQPQDLILRVKSLLNPSASRISPRLEDGSPEAEGALAGRSQAANPLTSLFAGVSAPPSATSQSLHRHAVPSAAALNPSAANSFLANAPKPASVAPADYQKLRNEVHRLELTIKKLQAQLEAQLEYCAALEAHIKTLTESQ